MNMDFIDEMIKNITKEKNKLDELAFFNFLREELERKGISLTVNRSNDLHLVPLNASNIIGVELDLSAYDKEKDSEIEKYKKAFEFAKIEKDKAVCKYQNEIDELNQKLEIQKTATIYAEEYVETLKKDVERKQTVINQIDNVLEELFQIKHDSVKTPDEFREILKTKTLPDEPIKMADWIVNHFKQGLYPGYKRDQNKNIKHVELGEAKIPLHSGEYEEYTEVREIADYLFVYCKHHSEEE